MVERVFCIGNGESRQSIDLIKLRPHGKIYGCNGLYRDFKPDVLTAVDGPMMHEVYQSGYDGELFVNLHNIGTTAQVIEPGQKIAQAVLIPLCIPQIKEIPTDSIYDKETSRGTGGFGSTGDY